MGRIDRWRAPLLIALLSTSSFLTPVGAQAAPAGAESWVARYESISFGRSAVVASPDGVRVYVASSHFSSETDSWVAVAYDAVTGAEAWVARPASGFHAATAIAVSPDGSRVFVTGLVSDSTTRSDYLTSAYDATNGLLLWSARFNRNMDNAVAIAVSPDGSRVFVTGTTTIYHPAIDMWSHYTTVAYDSGTGAQIWSTFYDYSLDTPDVAYSLAVSPDGARVYVTGESMRDARAWFDFATVAYDALTGSEIWAARYNGPNPSCSLTCTEDYARSVVVSPDGTRVYVTGESFGAGTLEWSYDYATVAYNAATGAERWVTHYKGLGDSQDFANSIASSPAGDLIFVTGRSDDEFATVAYNAATGRQTWIARYSGQGSYDVASLAVSPDGARVFVTGNVRGFPIEYYDHVTVAYDATTGRETWASHYGSEDLDTASSLAVSHDGERVYVTGYSRIGENARETVTVAYATGICAPGRYEDGPVTTAVHGWVEPAAGPLSSTMHDASCTAADAGA